MFSTIRVLAWGGIGDILLLTPAIRALKTQRSHSRITVYCTNRRDMEIFRHNPYVHAVKKLSWIHRILHHAKVQQIQMADYARIYPSLCSDRHASDLIGEMLGISLPDKRIDIYLSAAEKQEACQTLAGLREPVAIQVTGTCSKNKDWSLDRWEELIRTCAHYDFFQLGTRNEPRVGGAVDMRGLPLRRSFALLDSASAFIGIDSALAHAAAALDTPAVVLFGPSTPAIWGHANGFNIYKRLPCSPCIDILRDVACPYGRTCMESISVHEVGNALVNQIESKKKAMGRSEANGVPGQQFALAMISPAHDV
jgi:ADP-heptose:LPS heptosyltransferase